MVLEGGRRRPRRLVAWVATAVLATLVGTVLVATTAAADKPDRQSEPVWAKDMPGVQHLEFKYGPITITPGQNNIAFTGLDVPKPDVDGYIVGVRPNITLKNGKVPPVDVVHLHHGVWVNRGARGTDRGSATWFAAGEEKTEMRLPPGYGYPYRASDGWLINYMIHDLTSQGHEIYITYDIDFVPATAPEAASITPAIPQWMDVQPGIYPVFDVLKGSGGSDGKFTYPDEATDPYKGRAPKNVWTADDDYVLLGTAGHLHPGGLYTDLYVDRAGATGPPSSSAVQAVPGTAHLFRSEAKYFEPAGAVSWDVSMTSTRPDWKAQIKKGDALRINATYDTQRASWYESMGIMIVWMTKGTGGRDPFVEKVDEPGTLTHGHLPENDNHGGDQKVYPDATKFDAVPAGAVDIAKFVYQVGDMTGADKTIPVVKPGESITYTNLDAPFLNGIWHTITSCKEPCNKSTGIAYPLADGDVQFDSGQLGSAGPPTAGRVTWQTPPDLPEGTYTYFCRIHPFMRGAFKVDASS